MIYFVMIVLGFHIYDDVMFQVCDDDYDYEMTFMTLFIISKQVSWTKLWTIRWKMNYAMLYYVTLYVIKFNKWNINLNTVSYYPHSQVIKSSLELT